MSYPSAFFNILPLHTMFFPSAFFRFFQKAFAFLQPLGMAKDLSGKRSGGGWKSDDGGGKRPAIEKGGVDEVDLRKCILWAVVKSDRYPLCATVHGCNVYQSPHYANKNVVTAVHSGDGGDNHEGGEGGETVRGAAVIFGLVNVPRDEHNKPKQNRLDPTETYRIVMFGDCDGIQEGEFPEGPLRDCSLLLSSSNGDDHFYAAYYCPFLGAYVVMDTAYISRPYLIHDLKGLLMTRAGRDHIVRHMTTTAEGEPIYEQQFSISMALFTEPNCVREGSPIQRFVSIEEIVEATGVPTFYGPYADFDVGANPKVPLPVNFRILEYTDIGWMDPM